MNQNGIVATYQTTSSYHLEMGGQVTIHSDNVLQLDAKDALDAAQKTIEAIRESAPLRAKVTNLVLRCAIIIPESGADSSQGRPQESDDGPGA